LRSSRSARPSSVRRVKNGTPSTHPLRGDKLRALRRLQREIETSPFAFVSERGTPFTTAGFARMIERAAATAGLALKSHPHMLRHACGMPLSSLGTFRLGVWHRGGRRWYFRRLAGHAIYRHDGQARDAHGSVLPDWYDDCRRNFALLCIADAHFAQDTCFVDFVVNAF
jgi:integrase